MCPIACTRRSIELRDGRPGALSLWAIGGSPVRGVACKHSDEPCLSGVCVRQREFGRVEDKAKHCVHWPSRGMAGHGRCGRVSARVAARRVCVLQRGAQVWPALRIRHRRQGFRADQFFGGAHEVKKAELRSVGDWEYEAGRLFGPQHAHWDLAADKRVHCEAKDLEFVCSAIAHPCRPH